MKDPRADAQLPKDETDSKLREEVERIVRAVQAWQQRDTCLVYGYDPLDSEPDFGKELVPNRAIAQLLDLFQERERGIRLQELEGIPKVPLYLFGAKKGVKLHLSEGETKAVNASKWVKDRIAQLQKPSLKGEGES